MNSTRKDKVNTQGFTETIRFVSEAASIDELGLRLENLVRETQSIDMLDIDAPPTAVKLDAESFDCFRKDSLLQNLSFQLSMQDSHHTYH